MIEPVPSAATGSRTAGYVVVGALATVPAFLLLGIFGLDITLAGVVVLWICGILWLLNMRTEDPDWDRRPPRR